MKEKKGMDRACGAVCCHWRTAAVLEAVAVRRYFPAGACHRLYGEWLMLRGREKHKACRILSRVGRVLFALFVLSFAAVQVFVIGIAFDEDDPSAAPQADYYLVLGALVNPNGQPSAALAARCDTAIAVLNVNPGSQAILCGGQGGDEPRTEAAAMQDYMIAHGADAGTANPGEQVEHDHPEYSQRKKLLPEGAAVAVITNDYHLARARRLLAHAGLGDAGVPAKTPYPGQWTAVRCREYCSIMGLMFTGRW